jgi:hypothetical protein
VEKTKDCIRIVINISKGKLADLDVLLSPCRIEGSLAMIGEKIEKNPRFSA